MVPSTWEGRKRRQAAVRAQRVIERFVEASKLASRPNTDIVRGSGLGAVATMGTGSSSLGAVTANGAHSPGESKKRASSTLDRTNGSEPVKKHRDEANSDSDSDFQ